MVPEIVSFESLKHYDCRPVRKILISARIAELRIPYCIGTNQALLNQDSSEGPQGTKGPII
jgi:hypothetical protein